MHKKMFNAQEKAIIIEICSRDLSLQVTSAGILDAPLPSQNKFQ